MFWQRKSEIQKVLEQYGQIKGTQFLTYLFTIATEGTNSLKSGSDNTTKNLMQYAISNIRSRHNNAFLKEYSDFQAKYIKNTKLLAELSKEKAKYTDMSIFANPNPNRCEAKPTNTQTASGAKVTPPAEATPPAAERKQPVPAKNAPPMHSALGRDESKHISCQYSGREDDCPNDCNRCAIAIKTDADMALVQNQPDAAIKLYKRAVFAEPKFAEAWNNLGNAYGTKSEYNNALAAFEKAIAIDPVYGKALYGKAVTLRNMGQLESAMTLANAILELYDVMEVRRFKKELVEAGVEDTQYLLENKKAIIALDNVGFRLMKDNNLLNDEGKITVIDGLYRPDEFTRSVLKYCKRKYASLGEEKVHGEYIITSFYGSICATIFYSKNNQAFTDTTVFDYLNNHIDVEFTDVNAERMLNTKAGEERAEHIWNIISPYVGYSQRVFNDASVLTEDVILAAMKNAYEIGMLTALYYLAGKDKKHSLGTRSEIDNALSKLAASSRDYQDPPPESAMCYSMRAPDKVDIRFKCDKCGRMSTTNVFEGEENLMNQYRNLAKKFVALGHKAEVLCLCDDCAKRYFPSKSSWSTNNIVFAFTAKGATEPVYSFPFARSYRDFEYQVALKFLNGADTVEQLAEATGTKHAAKTYLDHVKTVIGTTKR